MVKRHLLILVALFCLTSLTIIATPSQPAQASIIGEPCSVHWVDSSIDGSPFVINTWLVSCPVECPVDVAGDINTGKTWCADLTPPPNQPAVYLDNACSASTSRTVTLLTDGTLGTDFEILANGLTTISGTSYTFTNLPEGLFTAQGQAHNSKGSSGWSPPAVAQQDYSPPTTTPNLVGTMGDNGWYISPVMVSFTANDAGCLGVKQTAYAVNSTPDDYEGTPFTVSDQGVNTLQYRSSDGYNLETQKSALIPIDTVLPSLTLIPDSAPNSSNWWNIPVNFTVQASDDTSDILSIEQDVNGSGLTPYTGAISFVTDGIHSLDAQATDNAGHVRYDGVVIRIDSVAPTLIPDVTGTTNGTPWFISPPTMTLNATDATSSVAGIGYTVNGGSLNLYSVPVSFTQDGVYDVQAIALDVAQNSTTESFQIAYDSTPPQLSINLVGDKGENGWFISPPTFVVTSSDATSDIGSIGYTVDNGGWNTYTAPVTMTREGLYGLAVEVRDIATNSTSHSFQIGYDITPPQTNAVLTETEDGMVVTLNRWDGVSGYALTRMAINGVWQDYHHPVTVTEKGTYWVQFFTTDFAGNTEAEKITSFTIEEAGVVVIQNPPVVSILPPVNPPNTPPFETDDDFPPNLGDDTLYYVSPPPPPVVKTPPNIVTDTRIITNGGGKHNGNTEITLHGDPNISRLPVIRESVETVGLGDVFPPVGHPPRLSTLPFIRERDNSGDTPNSQEANNGGNTIRFIPEIMGEGGFNLEGHPQQNDSNFLYSEPMEYVEHPVAFVPTPTTFIENNSQGSSIPQNAPLDVTMLAMMGLTLAGAGMMKSESARKKQDELAKENAVAQAQLAIAQAEQKQSAQENWAENQTMQAEANQAVMTQVTQSEANRQFWEAYALWEQKVAEAEAKRQIEEQPSTTGGMFPAGSSIEDLPPHLQKLFWELGNMHFEKGESGDWRFGDERGELGYHQYLIREALKNGDNEALMAHFQSANQWIDKSLTGWINSEMETTANRLITRNTSEQQKAFQSVNPNAFNGQYKDAQQKYYQQAQTSLQKVTQQLSVQSQQTLKVKARELREDLVERQREYLTSVIVNALSRETNRVEQRLQTNQQELLAKAKTIAKKIVPMVTPPLTPYAKMIPTNNQESYNPDDWDGLTEEQINHILDALDLSVMPQDIETLTSMFGDQLQFLIGGSNMYMDWLSNIDNQSLSELFEIYLQVDSLQTEFALQLIRTLYGELDDNTSFVSELKQMSLSDLHTNALAMEIYRESYLKKLVADYSALHFTAFFMNDAQGRNYDASTIANVSILELEQFVQHMANYGNSPAGLFFSNPAFYTLYSIGQASDIWNESYSHSIDPMAYVQFFREVGVGFISEPYDLVIAFREWQTGQSGPEILALAFGPLTVTTASSLSRAIRAGGDTHLADDIAQLIQKIDVDGQIMLTADLEDIIKYQYPGIVAITTNLSHTTLLELLEVYADNPTMINRIMRDGGLIPTSLRGSGIDNLTTHLNLSGTIQESNVRLSIIDDGHQLIHGVTDEAVREELLRLARQNNPQLQIRSRRICDIVAYNPNTNSYTLAESKGGDMQSAVLQLQNTNTLLQQANPGAQIGEFRIYTSNSNYVTLNDMNLDNDALGGYRIDTNGYLFYYDTYNDNAMVYELVNNQRVKIIDAGSLTP